MDQLAPLLEMSRVSAAGFPSVGHRNANVSPFGCGEHSPNFEDTEKLLYLTVGASPLPSSAVQQATTASLPRSPCCTAWPRWDSPPQVRQQAACAKPGRGSPERTGIATPPMTPPGGMQRRRLAACPRAASPDSCASPRMVRASGADLSPPPPPRRRGGPVGSDRFQSPPPLAHRRSSFSPPPAPTRAAKPPLMQALLSQDLKEVREVLKKDPEAARLPFFDHAIEPPLCCAIRTGCGPDFLKVLLEHQADVNATDTYGRSPLALLCSLAPKNENSTLQQWMTMPGSPFSRLAVEAEEPDRSAEEAGLLTCAVCLLAAGADLQLPSGQGATADLLKYYHGAQACAVLSRAAQRPSHECGSQQLLGQLSDGPIDAICAFMVPAAVLEKVSHPLGSTAKM